MKKLLLIMMYTTIYLYADASPPCYTPEFRKDSGSFYDVRVVIRSVCGKP
jgi:hypothetical protein